MRLIQDTQSGPVADEVAVPSGQLQEPIETPGGRVLVHEEQLLE